MNKLLNRHTVIFLLISILISVVSLTINASDAIYLESVLNFSSNSSNALSSFLDYFDFGYSFIAGSLAAVNPCGIVMLPVYLALYVNGEKNEKSPSFPKKINNSLKVIFSVGSGFIFLFVLITQGYVTKAIKADITNMVTVILTLFAVGFILAAYRTFWLSRELNYSFFKILTGSILDALIAGNIVDNIVVIKDIKNTKNTSSYLISEGSVDKK